MGLLIESESLAIVTIFLLCLSLLIVSLRCWVRISIKGFGLDDWLMVIGLIFYIGTCTPVIIGSHYGLGTRDIYLTHEQMVIGHKSYFVFQVFYCFDAIFTKSGICVALTRLSAHKRSVYYPAMVTMTISIISGVITLIIVLSVCTPIETQWNPAAGKCLSPSVIIDISYFISAAYGLADIALWSIVELGVGLSAGSAAALRPVLRLISTGSLLSSRQTKHSRNQFSTIEDTATMAGKDISLRVMVKGGKVSSAGDADSQNPILDEEGIFVRSEVNMGEEFVRRDAI
ncbi:hypothetical protein ACEPPN_000499 [Leptodophora sp. 'Broadleaf-Isolate-01']